MHTVGMLRCVSMLAFAKSSNVFRRVCVLVTCLSHAYVVVETCTVVEEVGEEAYFAPNFKTPFIRSFITTFFPHHPAQHGFERDNSVHGAAQWPQKYLSLQQDTRKSIGK